MSINNQKWDVDAVEKAIHAFALELESEDSTDESESQPPKAEISAKLFS